jgi:hypothetical protein
MTLEEFIADFQWEQDGPIDTYHILKRGEKGDCDDFGSTAGFIESGESRAKLILNILVGNLQFYWCYSPRGGAHVVLYSRKRKAWIDNINPTWRPKLEDGYTRVVYLTPLPPMLKLFLGAFIKR